MYLALPTTPTSMNKLFNLFEVIQVFLLSKTNFETDVAECQSSKLDSFDPYVSLVDLPSNILKFLLFNCELILM